MKNSKIFALILTSMLCSSINAQNTITNNGKTFIDLNKNRKLDLWEDTRLSVNKRIDAIIKQMTNEEKVEFSVNWYSEFIVTFRPQTIGVKCTIKSRDNSKDSKNISKSLPLDR
jgi:hypothetical protein